MSEPTATQKITAINEQLLSALCQKADAEVTVAKCDEQIKALRNVLAGISVGQQLAVEATPPAPPAV